MSTELERSNVRKAELAAKLVRTEERVLGLVERGLTSAGVTMGALVDMEVPSPKMLLDTVNAVEKLHKIAKDICGDAMPNIQTQINIGTAEVSSDLVAAVAAAYASVEQGHLERAQAFIEEADAYGDIIEGELAD